LDDSEVKLGQILQNVGDKMGYVYDLGDQWRHVITVEQILSPDESKGECICLDGQRWLVYKIKLFTVTVAHQKTLERYLNILIFWQQRFDISNELLKFFRKEVKNIRKVTLKHLEL
jgi:hypothetical protein